MTDDVEAKLAALGTRYLEKRAGVSEKEGEKSYEARGAGTDDLRDQVRSIRMSKGQVSEKRRAISGFVVGTLRNQGQFYKTDDKGLYYFVNASLTLYDIESVEFRCWINTSFGVNGSEPDWKFLLEDVKAHIVDQGTLTDIHRFACFKDGLLYVSCGEQSMYRLDGENITRVNNGTEGVIFLDGEMEPVEPAVDYEPGTVSRALVQANFRGGTSLTADDEKALYLIWIYACFFESILPTKAILLLHGVKGSGKTSNLRVLLRALFGKKAQVSVINSEKEDSFLAAIAANFILCIDNIDGRVKWLPNHLATAATGGDLVYRKLYTNNDLIRFRPRCFLALTSRQPDSFTRDDVADRLCILSVDRFKRFRPEREILAEVDEVRPAIWGELLQQLNEIVKRLKTHKPKTMDHRLADFADLATVIGPVIGIPEHSVAEILEKMDREKTAFALESHPVFAGLCAWIEDGGMQDREHITTAELFEEVKKAWDGMPLKSARSFGMYLKNMRQELESHFDVSGPITVRQNRKAWSIREKATDKSHLDNLELEDEF